MEHGTAGAVAGPRVAWRRAMLLQLRHYPIRLMFLSLLRVLPLLTLFLLLLLRCSIWLLLLLRQLSLRLGRRSCSGTRSALAPTPALLLQPELLVHRRHFHEHTPPRRACSPLPLTPYASARFALRLPSCDHQGHRKAPFVTVHLLGRPHAPASVQARDPPPHVPFLRLLHDLLQLPLLLLC